jgi:CBS domain-containing protein
MPEVAGRRFDLNQKPSPALAAVFFSLWRSGMKASDVMRTSIASVRPHTPVIEAARLLLKTNQRALPVVDDLGLVVGIISEGDFLHRAELDTQLAGPSWLDTLFGVRVRESEYVRSHALLVENLMNRDPVCVDEDAALDDVIAAMDTRGISQVPVVSGREVIGLVTRTELLATVERRLAEMARDDASRRTDAQK